jgi:integrase
LAFLRRHRGKKATYYYLVLEDKRSRRVGSNRKIAEQILADYHAKSRLSDFGIALPVRCTMTLKELMEADQADAARRGRDLATRGYVWKAILGILGADLRISHISKPHFERLATQTLQNAKGQTFNRRRALLIHALKLAHGMDIGYTFVDPRYKKLPEKVGREPWALDHAQADWLFGELTRVHPDTARYSEILLRTCSRKAEIRTARIAGLELLFPAHKRGLPRAFRIEGRLLDLLSDSQSATALRLPTFDRPAWESVALRFRGEFGLNVWPHLLRHTGLTWYGQSPEATPMGLQELAGWTSLAMAWRYLHPSRKAMSTVAPPFHPPDPPNAPIDPNP